MSMKIVFDSSADLVALTHANASVVPLKVITDECEYVDTAQADVTQMLRDLEQYKGKSTTSCPAVGDWIAAFADAEEIFCFTITSGLSGSYNSACIAQKQVLEEHPNRKIHVFDTLSAGPEIALIVEKAEELIISGRSFAEVKAAITEYMMHTRLIFSLKSLRNFANNGRVPHAVAKIAGLLGVRLIGTASAKGTLEPLDKARGERSALQCIYKNILKQGYHGGKMRIHHCENEEGALALKALILQEFPAAAIVIEKLRALCSFYAECGGILVGFEA